MYTNSQLAFGQGAGVLNTLIVILQLNLAAPSRAFSTLNGSAGGTRGPLLGLAFDGVVVAWPQTDNGESRVALNGEL
jgi:hypothetical protein